MKLYIGSWYFSPKLFTSLLALIFVYIFVSLGFWQLDRAAQKRTLFADFEKRQAAEELDFNLALNNESEKEELMWRNIRAVGEFLEHYQILLDNQVENTHAGYFIYTPFKLDQSEKIILVNRGWLLADKDRKISPELIKSTGKVVINGVVKDVPKTGLLLKEVPPEKMSETNYRVQRIDLKEIEGLLNVTLLPYIVRLEAESDHGYVRKWRLPGSGENTHNGYAFQWFAFAAALIIIYLILNIKKMTKQD